MEPFTIQCATCQSIIRVRNPKMIGQIVNCPKCNSMIQIEEPRQIRVESHRGVIDSNAMTKEAFAPELEEEYRMQPVESQSPQSTQAEQSLVAPPRADEFLMQPSATIQSPPIATSKSQTGVSNANEIQRLAVQRTARNRQVLMVAVLGASGVLVAGMLFTAFLYWYSANPKTDLAQNPDKSAQTTPGPKREPDPPVVPVTEDPNDGSMPQEPSSETTVGDADLGKAPSDDPSTTPSDNTLAESQTDTPNDNSANANASMKDNVAGDEQTKKNEGADLATALATQLAKENQAAPKETTEPANSADSADNPNDDSKKAASKASELPEQLKKFEAIMSQSIEPQLLPDAIVQKAPPTAEELGLPTGVDAKALAPVDVAERMQVELAGLILPEKSPFSVVVQQWVAVSGIPTVVDLDSLVAANIDPRRQLGIKIATKQSLATVGNMIAEQMGAELNSISNQFLALQASEAKIKSQLPTSMKVSDLISNAEQEAWLITALNQLLLPREQREALTEKDRVWTIENGVLTPDLDKVDSLTWFWALRALESWRAAAKLESQLSTHKPADFITRFVDPDAFTGLSAPLNVVVYERQSAGQVFAMLGNSTGTNLWVDWASAAQRGLGPDSLEFVVTQKRTLRQCLRDLATKYGLVVACEDLNSLYITTTATYQAQPRIYVLPSDGRTAEQWQEELAPFSPAFQGQVEPVRAFVTPDGQFVIVRCCRPRIRF